MRRSSEISALNVREARAWKVIDWAMSPKCKDAKVKLTAAEFVLKRIYPEKMLVGGEDGGPIAVQVYLPEIANDDIFKKYASRMEATRRPADLIPSMPGV